MSASVSSSTTGFSISSNLNPIPSSTTSQTATPRIRKRGCGISEANASQKRRKVIGRPRNVWTPSRRRKLVRLYLLTNLEVDEIAKVLRTDNFKPCKRDVQTQLAILLQPRAGQIRSKGPVTKQRLYQLRECDKAQLSRRSSKYPPHNSTTCEIREHDGNDTIVAQMEAVLSQTFPPTSTILGLHYPWLDSGWESLLFAGDDLVFEEPHSQQHESVDAISIAQLIEDVGIPLLPAPPINHEGQVVDRLEGDFSSPSSSVIPPTWSMSDFTLPVSLPTKPSMTSNIALSIYQVAELNKFNDMLPRTVSQSSIAEVSSPFASGNTSLEPGNDPLVASTLRSVGTGLCADDRFPIKPGAPRSITSSVASLKKRLSDATDKYSHSTLEDIVSVMERFTISTSSSSSTAPSRWSKESSSRYLPAGDVRDESRLSVEHPVILPGAFPWYCWEQIANNKLHLCNKGQRYRKAVICGHMSRKARQLTNHHSAQYKVYIGPGGEKVDIFGNSTLHIAAALETPLDLLMSLAKSDLSIHVLNNAGQTFLHLIHPDCVDFSLKEENLQIDICILLRELQERSFNFLQQDHRGRTALHWLTRHEIPYSALRNICAAILDFGIPFPMTRDNIGCSVIDRMRSRGVFKHDEELPPPQHSPFIRKSVDEDEYIHNYTSNDRIQTHTDLERYAYQADLLRTINESWKNPRYEDSGGRNGLHCLAEVTFDSPIPVPRLPTRLANVLSNYEESTSAKIVQSLEGLLEVGVDPNNHDKDGFTPLMAFIIHMSVGEDDISATQPLRRLYRAGADINRRNRQGETSLHLAVKLGRRAATNFLLGLKVNVHVRANNGLGVVALGHRYARKAKKNASLYAQIMLCVSLAVTFGAVSAPTIIDEWGTKSLMEVPRDQDEIRYKGTSWNPLEKL